MLWGQDARSLITYRFSHAAPKDERGKRWAFDIGHLTNYLWMRCVFIVFAAGEGRLQVCWNRNNVDVSVALEQRCAVFRNQGILTQYKTLCKSTRLVLDQELWGLLVMGVRKSLEFDPVMQIGNGLWHLTQTFTGAFLASGAVQTMQSEEKWGWVALTQISGFWIAHDLCQ